MSKKLITIALVLVIILTQTVSIFAATPIDREIKVYLDGQVINFPDQKPIIENSTTLVPVRFVSEALGAVVDWVQDEKKVEIKKGTDNIELVVGSKFVKIGNKQIQLNVATKTLNGRTIVPLRFILEAFGARVDWNQEEYAVYIKTKEAAGIESGYQVVNGFKTKTEENTSLTQLGFYIDPNYPVVDFSIVFRTGGWSTWKVIPEEELNKQVDEAREILIQRFEVDDVERLLKYGKTLWDNPIEVFQGEKVWRTIKSSYIMSKDKKLHAVISSGYGSRTFGIAVYQGKPSSIDVPLK